MTSEQSKEPHEDALYVWQEIVGDFDSVQERDESLAQYIWQEATKAAIAQQTDTAESIRLNLAFTCERTQERHDFPTLTDFIMAFLRLKKERDEATPPQPTAPEVVELIDAAWKARNKLSRITGDDEAAECVDALRNALASQQKLTNPEVVELIEAANGVLEDDSKYVSLDEQRNRWDERINRLRTALARIPTPQAQQGE